MKDWHNSFCNLCGADNPLHQFNSLEIKEMFNLKVIYDEVLVCSECDNLITNVKLFRTRALVVNEFIEDLASHESVDADTFLEMRNRFGLFDSAEHLIEHVEALDEAYEIDEKDLENNSKLEDEVDVVDYDEEHFEITENFFNFKCHVCDQDLESMEILVEHCQEIHQTSPQVLCSCDKILTSIKMLQSHETLHLKSREFICELCNISYKSQVAFEKHKKQKHGPNAVKFICTECGKEFKDKQILKNHERTHLPEEEKTKYPCSQCGKKFVNNHCLKIHVMRIHEKCAVFTCETCGKNFVTRSDLNWHKDKHIDERNFECDVCKCKFKSTNSLRIHKRRHFNGNKKYICRECGKEFNSSAALSNHKLVHSDVKRYKCFCGNEYKRLESYKCHLSVHSGVRPFSCQWCTRTFVNSANCRKHKLKEHPVEVKEFELIHGKKGVSLAVKSN